MKPFRAEVIARLSDEELRTAGLSRPKIRTLRALSQAVLDGTLNFNRLRYASEDQLREALTSVSGIGPWTADIYLLMVLRRPDIWPTGDLALAVAAQKIKRLNSRPSQEMLDEMSEAWKPWRAVAARILWHYYLSE